MASLGDLLQRIARSLEEAREQGPADDLRARLGYGSGDEDEDEFEQAEDAIWEPETETARMGPTDREPETRAARTQPIDWEPKTVWRPPAARKPAQPVTDSPASGPIRASAPAAAPGHRRSSPAAPHRTGIPSESLLSERVRSRLRTPDALREAFVVKEVLDRPLARRRRRREIR